MSELLPCPFCGGAVRIVVPHVADLSRYISHVDTRPCPLDFSEFHCNDDLETEWNRRASLQQTVQSPALPPGEVGKLIERLRREAIGLRSLWPEVETTSQLMESAANALARLAQQEQSR